MSDIEDLERRITAALDRVGRAIEGMGGGAGEDLSGALEAEKTANAQLEERVRAIKEKQETMVARLEDEVARLKAAVANRESEVQALRGENSALRSNNDVLRNAAAKGLPDAEAVTGALSGELERLRAERQAERAEIEDILAALAPVLDGEERRA